MKKKPEKQAELGTKADRTFLSDYYQGLGWLISRSELVLKIEPDFRRWRQFVPQGSMHAKIYQREQPYWLHVLIQ